VGDISHPNHKDQLQILLYPMNPFSLLNPTLSPLFRSLLFTIPSAKEEWDCLSFSWHLLVQPEIQLQGLAAISRWVISKL
jgi:hypothetical protein